MRTRNYKADLEELADGYEDARAEEFSTQFYDFIKETVKDEYVLTEDDIQGFIDSFDFLGEDEWCASEYQSRMESFEDAKYEEMKDERCGL